MPDEPSSTAALAPTAAAGAAAAPKPDGTIVQDLDSQPAAVETNPPAPSGLKIEMPKLDIAATSDAAEPQRSARDFTAREREVAKPALASTGVAALTARGAKDKKEAAAAAGESAAPPALSLKGRDPDAPMATPRKDAPETSRRKKAEMPDEPSSNKAAAGPAAATTPDGTIVQDLDSQPAASIVQDLDSQPGAVETKPPAPSGLKIEMPKLDIAATSDAAEPERPTLRESGNDLHNFALVA